MIIEIEGLTKAQEIAISDFFSKMQGCVQGKASRWLALFADGAGEWEGIDIKIDGADPVACGIPASAQRWWNLYFKDNEETYSPEPFYLAESYTIEQALQNHETNRDENG